MKRILIILLAVIVIPTALFAQKRSWMSKSRNDFTRQNLYGGGVSIYTVKNAPIGFNLLEIRTDRVGFYAEFILGEDPVPASKLIYQPPENGTIIFQKDVWRIVTLATVIPIERYYAVYFGFASSSRKTFSKYSNNEYFDDYELRKFKFGFVGGAIFSFPLNLIAKIGISTFPNALTLGLSMGVAPFWDR